MALEAPLFATLPAGLEPFAADEVAERGGRAFASEPGQVAFDLPGGLPALTALRSVERLYVHVGATDAVPTTADGPAAVQRWADGLPWSAVARRWTALTGAASATFRATVERTGEHAYRSPDVERALGGAAGRGLGWAVGLRQPEAVVFGRLIDGRLTVGVSLPGGDLSQRRRAALGPTALKPCVAHCMVRLAGLEPGWRVLDPLAGRGAIPVEVQAGWPGARIVAGDREQAAAAATGRALGQAGAARWDARRLPLGDASIDAAISDLPFGRRHGSPRANRRTYPDLFQELARVVRPGGVAVLLSGEVRLVDDCLAGAPWREERRLRIDLGGLSPLLLRLRRP